MNESGQNILASAILAISFALTGLAVWTVATSWNISTDLESLLPEDSKAAAAMDEMHDRLGSSTSLFVVVDSPSSDANIEFARAYADRLRQLPEVSLAHFHNDKTFFENHLLLYFDRSTLTDMRKEFEEKLDEKKKEANPLFVSLDDEEESDESGADDESIGEELSRKSDDFKHEQFKEYLVSSDGYSLTIIVRFQNTSEDLVETNRLLEKVKQVGRDLDPESYHPEMKLQYGGGLVKRKQQYGSIADDIRISALFTVIGVVLLISLYFRRIRAVGFVLIPLVMGSIGALAVGFTLFGQLTTISVFIFAILLGLGIDYGIHLLSSFDERLSAGLGPFKALRIAFRETGRATAIGAATTLATFTILSFANSRGLSEFGIVAGIGVIFTLTAMFTVLPAMILLGDRLDRSDETNEQYFSSGSRIAQLEAPDWLGRRGASFQMGLALVLTVGAAVAMPRVGFEQNIHQVGELMPPWSTSETDSSADGEGPAPSVRDARSAAESVAEVVSERATAVRQAAKPETFKLEREQTSVGEKYTSAVSKQISSVPTVLLFDSEAEAQSVHEYFRERLDAGELDTVRTVNSIHAFMPGTEQEQEERLEEIRKLRKLHRNEDLSVLEDETREQIERFEPSLDVDQPVDIYDLPDWTKRLYRENGPGAHDPSNGEAFAFENVLFVTSKGGLNNGDQAREFLGELRGSEKATGADFQIASPASVYIATLDSLRYEGFRLVLIALAVILAFLCVVFRHPLRGLVAAAPLVFGLLWMAGLAYLVGIRFDMFNVIIIPAIIGIGVDDGVHFYSRYLEYGRGSLWPTLKTVGTTIIMTSLTSMVGFGGLALADYHGVRSIGHLAVTGILTTLLATLIILPALIIFAESFGWTSILPEE